MSVYDRKIKNLSETRFYQLESRHWYFSNRALDVILIFSLLIYLFVTGNGQIENSQLVASLCIFIFCMVLLTQLMRCAHKIGFLAAYKYGFKDAASRHVIYQNGDMSWRFEHNRNIAQTWCELEKKRLDVSCFDKKNENIEIFEGFKKDCTWKYIFSPKKTTLRLQDIRV